MRATPKFQFLPVIRRLAGNLALVTSVIACLLAAPLAPAIRAEAAAPQALSSNRFLCIFDISAPMRKQSAAVQKSVQDILNSRASGQLHYGDTIGVWTFDAELRAGFFPLQVWLPGDEQEISLRLAEFLKRQPVGKPSRLGSAMAGVTQLIKGPDTLTVFIFSTGESPMTGTPFDQDINAAYQRALKEMKKDRAPIVTVLQARNGRYLKYTVTALPWPIAIPELPIPIKLAKTQTEVPAASTPTPTPPPVARTVPAVAPPVNPPTRPTAPPAAVAQPPAVPPAVVQTIPAPVVTPASPPPVAVVPPKAVIVPPAAAAPVEPGAPPAPDSAMPAPTAVVSPRVSPRSEIIRQRLMATSGVQPAAASPGPPAVPAAPPIPPPAEASATPNMPVPAIPAVSPRASMPAVPPVTPPAPTAQKPPASPSIETAVVTPPAAGLRSKAKLIAAIVFLIVAVALGLLALRRGRAAGPSLITRTMNDRRK